MLGRLKNKATAPIRASHGVLGLLTYRPRATSLVDPVYINLGSNPYDRYLYLFAKFLHIANRSVIIAPRPLLVHDLLSDSYTKLLFTERFVRFTRGGAEGVFAISDRSSPYGCVISPDYFTDLLTLSIDDADFYVPMAMHPSQYSSGFWNYPISKPAARIRSIFFAGNLDPEAYRQISRGFSVLDRIALCEQLARLSCSFPRSFRELLDGGGRHLDGVLAHTDGFWIPTANVRSMLAKYDFFLACPGVYMPHSHNLVEAMSVGTIPIIQNSYARLVVPPLEDGVNAIIFTQDTFLPVARRALQFDDRTINALHEGVQAYYENHMTPRAVIAGLFSKPWRRIMLIAEQNSVQIATQRGALRSPVSGT